MKNVSDKRLISCHVGCSGYYYSHWVGRFYPEGMNRNEFFKYYQQKFHTVELNTTFYHYPTEKQVRGWLSRSEEGFLFSLKAPRIITHKKGLRKCRDSLLLFFHLIKWFRYENKLGVILFQTPPSLPFDLILLEEFLSMLPPGYRYSFEFRNRDYYKEVTFELCRRKKIDIAFISDPDGEEGMEVCTDYKYLRLHGSSSWYSSKYTSKELESIAERIDSIFEKGVSEVYIYFNNDYNAYAPLNALELIDILKKREIGL